MTTLTTTGGEAVTASRGFDVAVIGAGVAGLTAARTLVDAGLSVRVHEARDRVGGRLLSSTDDGQTVDLGASWFWPHEPLVQSLARELGVATFPQALAGDAMFEADGRGPRRLEGNPIDVASGRFAAGAQALAVGLADRLPPGTVHLNDPVSRVHIDDDGVSVTAASGTTTAGHVVVALPPALAVEAITFSPDLPAGVRNLAESTAVWMGGVVKVVAVFDAAFWRDAGLAGAAVSHLGPFEEIHDHSGSDGRPAALFGFASADAFPGATAEQIGAAFTEQLRRLFGPAAASASRSHVTDWSRERYTTPRRPSPRAATSSYGHRLFQQAVAARMHWASTETSTEYAGHIEGALRAGTQAAHAVLALNAPAAAQARPAS